MNEALGLGLLQGLTEFLPVSSSGHLGLARIILGMGAPSLEFDLVLHVATLFAVLIYFSRDLLSLLLEWVCGFFNGHARAWAGWRFGWAIIVGVFVTAPIAIFLKKHFVESASENLLWLGGNLWITAILLFSSKLIREGGGTVRIRDGLFVGLLQGIAAMPGISRSGSTIWAGLLTGLSREEAFKFSFLLSAPTILGATLYDAREIGGSDAFFRSLPDGWLQGAIVSFIVGMLSLACLRKLIVSDRWWLFAVYCMSIGSISVIVHFTGA
ncbi:MAG: undecaprenyl-diphosphate phosphatase [Synergistaceae bacterium]|nr:undecaprenyl-diphosphate phosphatase [Synergistaceae bacterium]